MNDYGGYGIYKHQLRRAMKDAPPFKNKSYQSNIICLNCIISFNIILEVVYPTINSSSLSVSPLCIRFSFIEFSNSFSCDRLYIYVRLRIIHPYSETEILHIKSVNQSRRNKLWSAMDLNGSS